MVVRVVFAEDDFLFRRGTAALLDPVETVELVRVVDNAAALAEAVEAEQPDAVLTDFPDAVRRIRAERPGVGVVLLSARVELTFLVELLADGAAGLGYLLKHRVSDVDEVVRALLEVARGGYALDPQVVAGLLQRKANLTNPPLATLTPREQEVLAAMATGRSNTAIARALSMSDLAVEKHITSVFGKLGLADQDTLNRRVSAVLTFLQCGGQGLTR